MSENNTTATAPATPEPTMATAPTGATAEAPAQELTVQDLGVLKTIIEVAQTRGAFKANEMEAVGKTYSKLESFLIDMITCSYFLNLLFNFPFIKSDLFTTKIAFLVNKFLKTLVKSTFLADTITKRKSASSARFKAILIPFFSISFLELLIPAVSETMTG